MPEKTIKRVVENGHGFATLDDTEIEAINDWLDSQKSNITRFTAHGGIGALHASKRDARDFIVAAVLKRLLRDVLEGRDARKGLGPLAEVSRG